MAREPDDMDAEWAFWAANQKVRDFFELDEPAEDAADVSRAEVTAVQVGRPRRDGKNEIEAWLAEAGYPEAATALAEWTGPRSAVGLVGDDALADLFSRFYVLPMVIDGDAADGSDRHGLVGLLCTRHRGPGGDGHIMVPGTGFTPDGRMRQNGLTLAELVQIADDHESAEH